MYARLRCGGNLPLPRPGVDRPLRGNCHPLSCAPDNQVRCVFGSAPYQKPPSTVRNMRAVRKTGSCGTRRIIGSIRCKKQASTVRKRYSVQKTGSCGTEWVFKGTRCAEQPPESHPKRHPRSHPKRHPKRHPKSRPKQPPESHPERLFICEIKDLI